MAGSFDALEQTFFEAKASRVQDPTIVLTSPHGYFRVYQYDNQGNPADKHLAIFFFNKRSQQTFEMHGTIARDYLARLKSRTAITDFPITDELVINAIKRDDRISCLSLYALQWSAATNAVTRTDYKTYEPTKPDFFVACTQEFAPTIPEANYQNWQGGQLDWRGPRFDNDSRKLRPTGMPTQVVLHETATLANLSIAHVKKAEDGTTALIPHFCINKVDKERKGNILQYVDVVERTSHAVPLNDRTVGIEFVNAPIEARPPDKPFNHHKSVAGIYLRTVLVSDHERFLPLEFYPLNDDTAFALTIPEEALVNKGALVSKKVGPGEAKLVETKAGMVTLGSCRSDRFEHLVSLVRLLESTGQLPGLKLDDPAQHLNVHKTDGRELFLFERAWLQKDHTLHFAVDIRLAGIFCHGLTGTSDHVDGFWQALYVYLRIVRKLAIRETMQKIIDLVVRTKANASRKRPDLRLAETVMLKGGNEAEPVSPETIVIKDYLDIT